MVRSERLLKVVLSGNTGWGHWEGGGSLRYGGKYQYCQHLSLTRPLTHPQRKRTSRMKLGKWQIWKHPEFHLQYSREDAKEKTKLHQCFWSKDYGFQRLGHLDPFPHGLKNLKLEKHQKKSPKKQKMEIGQNFTKWGKSVISLHRTCHFWMPKLVHFWPFWAKVPSFGHWKMTLLTPKVPQKCLIWLLNWAISNVEDFGHTFW